jgi:hypothetical protein
MIFRKASWLLSGLAVSVVAGSMSTAWAMPEFGWNKQNTGWRRGTPNTPLRLEQDFNYNAKQLPLKGRLTNKKMPYGDTYWPANLGGIAHRWNSGKEWFDPYLIQTSRRFSYKPDTSKMSGDERAVVELFFSLPQAKREEIRWRSDENFRYDDNFCEDLRKKTNLNSVQRYDLDHGTCLHSEAELRTMSQDEIAKLSPTEKYDIVRGVHDRNGRLDYVFTKRVLSSKANGPNAAYWGGICHGWAPASTNHAEPLPNNVTLRNGIVVPFGSADVKAMLDYYYGTVSMSVRQMGMECHSKLGENPGITNDDCEDTNAGAFHVVLANYIGLRNQAFVAEYFRGDEVWNNPIYAYETKIVGRGGPVSKDKFGRGGKWASAPGTVRRVLVETKMLTPSDDQRLPPQWDAVVGKNESTVPESEGWLDATPYKDVYRYEELKYKYWLDIDANDNIIGGEWVSEDRPDYIWMKTKMEFTGEFEALNGIYKPAF